MNDEEKKSIVDLLGVALEVDPDFYEAWKANIAMAFLDTARWHCAKADRKGKPIRWSDMPAIANKAADNFLKLLMEH